LPEPFSQESLIGLLPIKNSDFTGRMDQLAEIERSLNQVQQGVITQSVVGLGGVGKTQLVTEYVYQSFKMKRYSYIVWLDGRNPLQAYKDLGKAFHIEFESNDSEDQCITKIEQLLKSRNASLLLVWDDAKDQAEMRPFLASAARLNAHCLITSRAQYFGGARTNLAVIRLDVFKAQQCIHSQHTSDQAFSGSWAQALIAYKEALEKNERFFGEQVHADIALAHWHLSSCYLQQEDYTQALGHVEKSYTSTARFIWRVCRINPTNLCRETYPTINGIKLESKKLAVLRRISTSQSSTVTLNPQESNNIATSAGSIAKNCNHFYRPSSQATSATASEEESYCPK
jgi:tetratricopeptide (TPR) repeat protein